MTKQDFFGGISRPVNEVLARIFIQLGLIEQTGHGVSIVTEQYGKEAFEFLDNFLHVIIPFNYKLEKNSTQKEQSVPINDTVNDTVKLIYKLLVENKNITIKEIMSKIKKSRPTITRAISTLKDQNKIKRVGSDKTGYWEIIE